MNRPLNIAPVTARDLPAIAELHAHFWGEVSDVDEMARSLERPVGDPDHIILAPRARAAGCNQIILLTETVRSDAIAFYESAGYAGRWAGFKKKL